MPTVPKLIATETPPHMQILTRASTSLLVFVALLWVTPAHAADAWRTCRPETKGIVLHSERVTWQISPCLGGLQSVRLDEPQFALSEDDRPTGVPEWAAPRFVAGPMDLVRTWDAKWDPFRDTLVDVQMEAFEVTTRPAPGEKGGPETRRWESLKAYHAANPIFGVLSAEKQAVTLVWPDPSRVKSPIYLLKRYSLAKPELPYSLEVEEQVWNVGPKEIRFKLQHAITTFHDKSKQDSGMLAMLSGPPDLKGAGFYVGDSVTHLDTSSLADADPEERTASSTPAWLRVDSRYFILATLPGPGWGKRSTARVGELSNGVIEAVLVGEGEALSAGADGCVPAWYATHWGGHDCAADFEALGLKQGVAKKLAGPFLEAARQRAGGDPALTQALDRVRKRQVRAWQMTLFTGPKQLEYLKAMGSNFDESIDFGWFGLIALPLLKVLKFSHGMTGSWPLGILILTVMVKLLLWKFTTKSMRSMYKMQRVKPELDKIKEKLTEEAKKRGEDRPDPQELNKQTFALYKRHGVNPLGGCLPMFIQMPVYIALYRTIYSSVELFNQPLFGWVTDLTQKDPYYVLPVVLGLVMFLQQRLMPNPGGDQTQRKMMLYGMPVMFALMMMSLPSGLTFYILVNTVLSGVQTAYLKRSEAAEAAQAA